MSETNQKMAVMTNKLERMEKERRILELATKGVKDKSIAETLGMSLRTVERYKARIAKRLDASLSERMPERVVSMIEFEKQLRKDQLWAIASKKGNNVGDRTKALRELRVENNDFFERCQDLGILPSSPPEVNASSNLFFGGTDQVSVQEQKPINLRAFMDKITAAEKLLVSGGGETMAEDEEAKPEGDADKSEDSEAKADEGSEDDENGGEKDAE